MTHTLKVTVHQATRLEDVERFGENDPYAQISLDLKAKRWPKTKTAKNAGKEATWNQTLELSEYNPQEQKELYVDILDEEIGFDEPIAFTTIPLNQVNAAHGRVIRGRFDLFTVKGEQKGEILLTIAVVAPGQSEAAQHPHTEVRGVITLDSEHQAHVKSLKHKESAGDAGMTAAALGGAYAAKVLLDDSKKTAREAEREV